MSSDTPSPPPRRPRSVHLIRSSVVVMAAFVVSKIVGLLRDRAIAHQFGATPELDAYVAAFKIPDLLFTLIAGGALISAFLPVFADALAHDEDDEAWTIASGVTSLIFTTTAVFAALAALAAPWLVAHVVAPGFPPAEQALTASLMRIILFSTLIFAVSGIQMGILNAFQHFLLPALAPIAYNLGILFGAIWLVPRFGIYGLAYGVVIGATLHLVIKIPGLIRYGFRYIPTFGLSHPGVHMVLWLMWPRMLALGTVQAVFIVNTRLASSLAGGSLSALNYAWLIAQMPQTILGTAVATVAFPTLAALAARGERDAMRSTAVTALRVMIVLSVPAAVGLALLGAPVIEMLLETGRFDQSAADATLLALQMFALGLVGQVTLEIVARLFYAQKNTLTPLYLATLAMVVNIALAYLLVIPMAQAGLALANSVAVTLEVLIGLWLLRRQLGGIGERELAGTLGRSGLAAAAMGVAIYVTLLLLPESIGGGIGGSFVQGLIRAGIGGLVGGAVYLAAGLALGIDELRLGLGMVTRRLGLGGG